jgi:hypothetical protein
MERPSVRNRLAAKALAAENLFENGTWHDFVRKFVRRFCSKICSKIALGTILFDNLFENYTRHNFVRKFVRKLHLADFVLKLHFANFVRKLHLGDFVRTDNVTFKRTPVCLICARLIESNN